MLTQYIEMKERPSIIERIIDEEITFDRREGMSNEEYRGLYLSVGEPFGWFDRVMMRDEELRGILDDEANEVFVMEKDGEIIGYTEIDRHDPSDVEIVFLAIRQKFFSRGFGRCLLELALRECWKEDTKRIWLHTCDWDHERALPMYLARGFVKYDERIVLQKVPDDFDVGSMKR